MTAACWPTKCQLTANLGLIFTNPPVDPLSIAITETLADTHQHLFEQGFVDVMDRSIKVQRVLSQALEGSTLTTVFPDTGLGNQLRMVARLIVARDELGLKKQCFFCSIGGFDTHGEDQLTGQSELLGEISAAVTAFYAAALGRWFGADDTVSAQVFPRLQYFNGNEGFLG